MSGAGAGGIAGEGIATVWSSSSLSIAIASSFVAPRIDRPFAWALLGPEPDTRCWNRVGSGMPNVGALVCRAGLALRGAMDGPATGPEGTTCRSCLSDELILSCRFINLDSSRVSLA